jgi:PqqD family protein of HPr-rel-A system
VNRPAPHPATETATFADDGFRAVVFDERTAAVHTLSPVASAVWALCDGETTVAQMTDELTELFAVDHARVRSDVDAALTSFRELGLLV